ncbi:MAG TPA: chemotaxis protein CheA [Caulobacteraceae bacterium]|jgi:two-component system chemotaxis sensor kinase CheA|nr:chemotaxis protein CheA [Caulobacteraceae bacterium]
MNEFVEQFLVECRELIEQATDDLLTLEGKPDDSDRLDGAFRAFHTLKGAASIVDFDAMARALHGAEDVLSSVRAGDEPVTPDLISDCLTCLDQVSRWLDAMRQDGEIPADADAAADEVARRFDRFRAGVPVAFQPLPWIEALVGRHPDVGATVALRYAPDRDAFLRGEDPLRFLAALPSLLVLEVEDSGPPPPLDEFDPFASHLVFLALAPGSPEAVRAVLRGVGSQVEIVDLAPLDPARAGDWPELARGLLEAQLQLLDVAQPDGLLGCIGSAGAVVANLLRHAGRLSEVAAIDSAIAASHAARRADVLSEAIRRVLSGALPAADRFEPELERRIPTETAARTLRVDVERIDALVNLCGELLVAKNALGHAAVQAQTGMDQSALAALLKDQHGVLQRLVDELQRSVLNIRVLPMRYVFQRFPRLVREMVVSLGKPAHLVTEGDDAEADKVIIESLFEPLLHVVRNALDHGVEDAATRTAAGKPAAATITLRARRESDNVMVELSDDGGGIDVARVRAVAAERGLATSEALSSMAEADLIDLVFSAGFSTAAAVTSLSGRGVGMDAVRTAIERLGGRVAIESRKGLGTTVRFILPFAVLVSRVLTVEAGGQWFGIPLESVLETVRIRREDVRPVGAAKAFVLRQRTVPLIDLRETLGEPGDLATGDELDVVVAAAGGRLGGLEVDRLGERLDVMLKPMEGLLSGMPGISGTTMLGDGRVLLVLDLQELLQ